MSLMLWVNKLGCLSKLSFSGLACFLPIRLEPTLIEQIMVSGSLGRLLALPKNLIASPEKNFPETNTLAYFVSMSAMTNFRNIRAR